MKARVAALDAASVASAARTSVDAAAQSHRSLRRACLKTQSFPNATPRYVHPAPVTASWMGSLSSRVSKR